MIQLDGKTHLNPFTLKFSNQETEEEFRENYLVDSARYYRFIFLTVMFFQFIRLTRDIIIGDSYYAIGYLIMIPVLSICLYFTYYKKLAKFIPAGIVIIIFASSTLNSILVRPNLFWFVISLYSIMIFAIFTVARLFFIYAFSLAATLNLLFLVVCYYTVNTDFKEISFLYLPVLLSNMIGGAAGYAIEKHKRFDFYTNRRLAENIEALSASNKLKNDIMGIAVHDIKNPLTIVNVYSELILAENEVSEKTREQIEIIKLSTDRISSVVNYLLELAQLETGEIHLNVAKVNISELTEQVVNQYSRIAASKDQIIGITIQKELYLNADLAKISSAFENLISNAIKYTPLHKSIEISLAKRRNSILFSVEDDGPGIAEEDVPKLFQKWQKLKAKPTGNEISSGLGLSITKRFVDLHRGFIRVGKSAVLSGTIFTIELPLE